MPAKHWTLLRDLIDSCVAAALKSMSSGGAPRGGTHSCTMYQARPSTYMSTLRAACLQHHFDCERRALNQRLIAQNFPNAKWIATAGMACT
eukprot:4823392-Amphidinium_carterae.1